MVPVSWLFSSDSVASPAAFASVAEMDPACTPGVTRDTLEPATSLLIDAAKWGSTGQESTCQGVTAQSKGFQRR